MKIALAFPERGRDTLGHFLPQICALSRSATLFIFPEAFENLYLGAQPRNTQDLKQHSAFKRLYDRYQKLADHYGIAIVTGISVHTKNARHLSLNGAQAGQFALAVTPYKNVPAALYQKNTTAASIGFDNPDWQAKDAFPVFEWRGTKFGISLCHDMFNSLIPAQLKKAGAALWINPSFQNVRPNLWLKIMAARAVELGFPILTPLHRSSQDVHPQKEIYAFTPQGKLTLSDAFTKAATKNFQTGRFYLYDSDAPSAPLNAPVTASLPKKAEGLLYPDGHISGRKKYTPLRIKAVDFIHSPEKIWRAVFKSQQECPVFEVIFKDRTEYDRLKDKMKIIMPARAVEFSNLTMAKIPDDPQGNMLVCYRSSNYKDTRLSYTDFAKGPFAFDERYLFGPSKTLDLSIPKKTNRARVLSNLKKLARD